MRCQAAHAQRLMGAHLGQAGGRHRRDVGAGGIRRGVCSSAEHGMDQECELVHCAAVRMGSSELELYHSGRASRGQTPMQQHFAPNVPGGRARQVCRSSYLTRIARQRLGQRPRLGRGGSPGLVEVEGAGSVAAGALGGVTPVRQVVPAGEGSGGRWVMAVTHSAAMATAAGKHFHSVSCCVQ